MLLIARAIGLMFRLFSPGYSWCYRCWWPWTMVRGHSTTYEEFSGGSVGCFPLCESCWRRLTPERRLPYYRQLVDEWTYGSNGCMTEIERAEVWANIRAAVLAGR